MQYALASNVCDVSMLLGISGFTVMHTRGCTAVGEGLSVSGRGCTAVGEGLSVLLQRLGWLAKIHSCLEFSIHQKTCTRVTFCANLPANWIQPGCHNGFSDGADICNLLCLLFPSRSVRVSPDGMESLVTLSCGDMRRALNILQV